MTVGGNLLRYYFRCQRVNKYYILKGSAFAAARFEDHRRVIAMVLGRERVCF